MPSSSNTSGDEITIDEVLYAWTDNGNKMWSVTYTHGPTQGRYVMRTWARDELDAYTIAMKKLEGAS